MFKETYKQTYVELATSVPIATSVLEWHLVPNSGTQSESSD